MKTRVAESKKNIGEQPSKDQSKQILWNVDSDSKRIALADNFDSTFCKDLIDRIDMKYIIVFAHMEYKATSMVHGRPDGTRLDRRLPKT